MSPRYVEDVGASRYERGPPSILPLLRLFHHTLPLSRAFLSEKAKRIQSQTEFSPFFSHTGRCIGGVEDLGSFEALSAGWLALVKVEWVRELWWLKYKRCAPCETTSHAVSHVGVQGKCVMDIKYSGRTCFFNAYPIACLIKQRSSFSVLWCEFVLWQPIV